MLCFPQNQRGMCLTSFQGIHESGILTSFHKRTTDVGRICMADFEKENAYQILGLLEKLNQRWMVVPYKGRRDRQTHTICAAYKQ